MGLRRSVGVMWCLATLAACGGGGSGSDTMVAGGAAEVEVDALNYEVTADRYQRWLRAQSALDAIPGLAEPPSLDPATFDQSDVDRAIRYLDADPRARDALARAGVTPREYVLTTLALDQALVASNASARATPSSRRPAAERDRSSDGNSSASPPAPGRRSSPRYRNVPSANTDLVERNREEIGRVRSGMRFRIVKDRPEPADADEPGSVAVVPAGTTLDLRLNARVCASTHKAGDRVGATTSSPVTVGGATIPAGAPVSLSVAGGGSGALEFAINSISVGGRTHTAVGSATASDVERTRVGSSRRDAEKVVGGAAIGAVAGQVLGKDTKSTVIGAAVGAAAGAAAASASGKSDTCAPAGAALRGTLRDALELRL